MDFKSVENAREVIVEAIEQNNENKEALLEKGLFQFPSDNLLKFLSASNHATNKSVQVATKQFLEVVNESPNFHIARFQLGFFALTSEQYELAGEHLSYFHNNPTNTYLDEFASGLIHLLNEKVEYSIQAINSGLEKNKENLPLNKDMQYLVNKLLESLNSTNNEQPTLSSNEQPGLSNNALLNIYNSKG